jgi:flagellar FliJ protein
MKSRDTLMRLRRFQCEEKRRRVLQIEAMVAEFARMAGELTREIAAEEQRARITDTTHFAYPTYARAARGRREKLESSILELREQLEEAKAALAEAQDELAKAESLEGRERVGERAPDLARDRLDSSLGSLVVRSA